MTITIKIKVPDRVVSGGWMDAKVGLWIVFKKKKSMILQQKDFFFFPTFERVKKEESHESNVLELNHFQKSPL